MRWYVKIKNDYLNVERVVYGPSEESVKRAAERQLLIWQKEALKKEAEEKNNTAVELVKTYSNILVNSLKNYTKLEWDFQKDNSIFHEFYLSEAPPKIEDVYKELRIPVKDGSEKSIFKSKREKRLQDVSKVNERFNTYLTEYQSRLEVAKNNYEQFKMDIEKGEKNAIEKCISIALDRSQYPEGFDKTFDLEYDPTSKTIVIAFELPSKDKTPKVSQYKFVSTHMKIERIEMKQKEFENFFGEVIYQICLRTIHEIFDADYTKKIELVVFNGWANGIDPKTGNSFRSCIISCQASREEFETYNLENVSPKECFRNLKGISAGPLAQLAPVKPIIELRKTDSRFVESRDVLFSIDSSTNLALMDWEDFEHLVRELFEKMFVKYGGEIKVTQASRDGGVDAIAFDPDPIRGGKFVVQAKRYNIVVPVSAVRDLYGTMIHEGATKGILVTTSYYGNDSRKFVKDKPITLIDGSNLVYLFKEYGYNVNIELQKKD